MRSNNTHLIRWLGGPLGLALVACSGGDTGQTGKNQGKAGSSGGANAGANAGVIFGQSGEDGGSIFGNDNGFQACAAESVATEAVPLDIYIMFDRSCSMSCPPERAGPGQCCIGGPRPRIDQVRNAVGQFLQEPASSGIGVGIGYFGYFPTGQTSCNPADYATPDVPIATLPAAADPVINSLNSIDPVGETPTGAAIRGACTYARQHKTETPGRSVVILLVTDGVPEAPVSFQCNPTLADAEMAAADCAAGPPGIPTYVLGVGANLDNLGRLAAAGGTGDAYLVDGNTEVTDQVLQALTQIRDAANVPCDFGIPPPPSGETLNPGLVNVTYSDTRGEEHLIASVGSKSGCTSDGGWHFDNVNDPTVVRLCPASCDRVTAQLIAASVIGRSASIDLKYGCETVVDVR